MLRLQGGQVESLWDEVLPEDVPRAVEFRGGGPRSDGQAVTSIDASLVGVRAASA